MRIDVRAGFLVACAALALWIGTGSARTAPAVLGAPEGSGQLSRNPGALNPAPGHFAGKFELVPLFSKGKPVIRNGHSYYAVRNELRFRRPNGDLLTVPAGMQTDLASVPGFLWATLPPDGPYAEAATFHDLCYRSRAAMTWHGHVGREAAPGAKPYSRADCDEILREGMVALSVAGWKRVAVFDAVRALGGKGFGS